MGFDVKLRRYTNIPKTCWNFIYIYKKNDKHFKCKHFFTAQYKNLIISWVYSLFWSWQHQHFRWQKNEWESERETEQEKARRISFQNGLQVSYNSLILFVRWVYLYWCVCWLCDKMWLFINYVKKKMMIVNYTMQIYFVYAQILNCIFHKTKS